LFNYDRLQESIKQSGKTKTYLCEKMGKPNYYLRDVIKQKNKIPEELQKILADELGVTVEWLNGAESAESPPPVGDGLVDKISALAQSPGLLEELNRFLELAAEDPETARRFLAFAVQELQSLRPLR